ncbi:hypothetical protein ACX27_27445 [Nostoc piscinale CENA21]|uniref:Uncharacterized protein n=2 Tax=Nostoc TaxID=1177 RepID=A0A0M3V6J2_9NOSO|nr:hypothetical protein ACX27_27445 [Nostoc piscinale CENA21]
MYQIYSIDTLKVKSLVELKAIAQPIGAVAQDKRSKQSWIDAIEAKQPQPVQPVNFDVDGSDVVVDGVVIASIEQDDNLTQPYFVAINGVEIFRDAAWGKCFSYICWHYKQGTLPIPSEPADDYLFHEELNRVAAEVVEAQQPAQLPQVGDSHFIGNYFLRCAQVSGDCAAVWDVSCDGAVMGEIRMGWDCFWSHTMSLGSFATPQEAVIDLHEFAQELIAV